jgi:predicted small secreted protein
MVEMILAGVIIGGVCAAAVVTDVRDRRRRRQEILEAERSGVPYGEPIPGGWIAAGDLGGDCGGAGGGDGC